MKQLGNYANCSQHSDFPTRESVVTGQFMLVESLQIFMSNNGISHVKVAPNYPSSNGLAEMAVKIFKRNMERQTTVMLKTNLATFYLTIGQPLILPQQHLQLNY